MYIYICTYIYIYVYIYIYIWQLMYYSYNIYVMYQTNIFIYIWADYLKIGSSSSFSLQSLGGYNASTRWTDLPRWRPFSNDCWWLPSTDPGIYFLSAPPSLEQKMSTGQNFRTLKNDKHILVYCTFTIFYHLLPRSNGMNVCDPVPATSQACRWIGRPWLWYRVNWKSNAVTFAGRGGL